MGFAHRLFQTICRTERVQKAIPDALVSLRRIHDDLQHRIPAQFARYKQELHLARSAARFWSQRPNTARHRGRESRLTTRKSGTICRKAATITTTGSRIHRGAPRGQRGWTFRASRVSWPNRRGHCLTEESYFRHLYTKISVTVGSPNARRRHVTAEFRQQNRNARRDPDTRHEFYELSS
jgi:hypothetical protein